MEIYYQLLEKLRAITEKCLTNQPEPREEKGALLLYAIAKADKTLRAIVLLCRNGMGEDALILCRSVFEMALTIEYIFSDRTNHRAKRYFLFDWIQRKKMYKYMLDSKRFGKYLTPENIKIVEEVKKEAKRVKKIYKYGATWSDKSIYRMAEEVGFLGLYESAYRIQCSFSHSNPRSMNDYFKEENGQIVLNYGPSDNLVRETLVTVFGSYYHILYRLNDYFNKGYSKDIKNIEDEFVKEIKALL